VHLGDCLADLDGAVLDGAVLNGAVNASGRVEPYVLSTVDTLAAQRRPLTDRLGPAESLLSAAAEKPRSFGESAE
jgi:hypothetical protein